MAHAAHQPADPGRRRLGLSVCSVLLTGAAAAPMAATAASSTPATPADPPPPAEVARLLPAAALWGRGTMRFFGLRVYDLLLWAPAGFAIGEYTRRPFALSLVYARSFSAQAIADRSLDEMRRIEPIADELAQRWRAEMAEAFADVRDGDRLTGIHLPGQAVRFHFNGQATRAIDGAVFARLFFGIWLSPQTSEPGLRQQLLAGRS